jgi:cardiolipin synthase
LFAFCAALSACASVPDIDETVGQSSTAEKPQIMGARGPLTARQSKALFSKMGVAAQDTLQRHLVIEQAVAETPLIAGNRTHVLRNGEETFRAMFTAIRGAKHHINLEYFIFEDVESDGVGLGDLLVSKRAQGVTVNVIYDSFGSSGTPSAFFDRLKDADVGLVQFNPLNPLSGNGNGYSINARDHRKILIVDGSVAIVGGVNLSASYQGSLPGKSSSPEDKPAAPWRDTDLEIAGPAVTYLQQLFFDHWTGQNGPSVDDENFFPKVPDQGKEVVRIIGSTPDNRVPRYYVTVLSAIRNAEAKVWLSAAYFVPTHQEMEDLLDAARRGVDVRILLPDDSDSELAMAVQHSRYEDLLEAGVKIYESHDEVLHSKTIVVDGVWSVIGSSNFDHRSVVFNDEVDAVVVGSDTAKELERMFGDDLANAHQIDRMEWGDRPLGTRFKDFVARIWQIML